MLCRKALEFKIEWKLLPLLPFLVFKEGGKMSVAIINTYYFFLSHSSGHFNSTSVPEQTWGQAG